LESFNGQSDPFKEILETQQKLSKIKDKHIEDPTFQEEIFKFLQFDSKEHKMESEWFNKKPSFPLKYTPNLKSKSKWTIRWHPKIAAKVKYAYKILFGSINSHNPHFNPKLRELLGYLNRCMVCRLTNKEWHHPEGIITSGNTGGRCSAKIADPIVPQYGPNVVYYAQSFGATTIERSEIPVEIFKSNQDFGATNVTALIASTSLTQLKPITARPPGTTFLGAQPSRVNVRLNDLQGKQTSMIVDSGSNISLISTRVLDQLNPRPKEKEGQPIKINQVTGQSVSAKYVPTKIYLDTAEGPVSMDIDAYIVKDMNAPLILGNDFADQYSLSILRENGSTSLRLGDTGRTIPLDNSVDSSCHHTWTTESFQANPILVHSMLGLGCSLYLDKEISPPLTSDKVPPDIFDPNIPVNAHDNSDISTPEVPYSKKQDSLLKFASLRHLGAKCAKWIDKMQRAQKHVQNTHRTHSAKCKENDDIWLNRWNLSEDQPPMKTSVTQKQVTIQTPVSSLSQKPNYIQILRTLALRSDRDTKKLKPNIPISNQSLISSLV